MLGDLQASIARDKDDDQPSGSAAPRGRLINPHPKEGNKQPKGKINCYGCLWIFV
jgi:hypothetical protein